MHIELYCWRCPSKHWKDVWDIMLVEGHRRTQVARYQIGDDAETKAREFAAIMAKESGIGFFDATKPKE